MKVIVTGGAGFIGSHIVDTLIHAGHEVSIIDNLSTGKKTNINPNANFYETDIRDLENLKKIFAKVKPDVINHQAAHAIVNASINDPTHDADINVIGSINLLQMCKEFSVKKFIFASSGGAIYGHPQSNLCKENHPIQPLSPYGAAKASIEIYAKVFHQTYDIEFIGLRYGNVFGPRQDPYGEAGVVAIFIQKMLRNQSCIIYGSGEQERDFVYVEDVAKASLLSLENHPSEYYNIGTGLGTNVNDIFGKLKELTHYNGKAIYETERKGEVYKITLDSSKAFGTLGWKHKTTIDDGLQATVEYMKL